MIVDEVRAVKLKVSVMRAGLPMMVVTAWVMTVSAVDSAVDPAVANSVS